MPEGEISSSPPSLFREIETASSIPRLRELDARILHLVRSALGTGADIRETVRTISRLNDAMTLRLIALLERSEGISLPEGATYLTLGSEGRSEQSLRTDQDSAVVFSDDLSPEKVREVERFSCRLVDALEEIGVPRCTGNIMASNPEWCRSLSQWKRLLNQWINVPTPENMLSFGMFQGLRALHGDRAMEQQLREHICTTVRRPTLFFPSMARHALRFPPPLTVFGRIRVERRGEHKGRMDIKKAGIFAITVGVSVLALEAGRLGGSTWDKLEYLEDGGILSSTEARTIENAFTTLVQLRLQWQLRELASRSRPTNHLELPTLDEEDQHRLRHALKGVLFFLRLVSNRYHLGFISR